MSVAAGSGWRISDSPMRKAWYPAAAHLRYVRCGADSALGDVYGVAGKPLRPDRVWVRGSTCMVCRLRLFTPMRVNPRAVARASSARSCTSQRTFSEMRRASSRRIFSSASVSAATMSRMASAAGGAGFENLEWIEDEALAQAGNRDGGGREGEVFERPLEEFLVGEHGERGCSRGFKRARHAAGSKSGRMSPREGEAFFNSAMMAGPEAAALAQGRLEPRGDARRPSLEKRDVGDGAPFRHFELRMREICSSCVNIIVLPEESSVRKGGLEPPHPCEYMDLNHARLPIPPLRHLSSMSRTLRQDTALVSFSLSNTGSAVNRANHRIK